MGVRKATMNYSGIPAERVGGSAPYKQEMLLVTVDVTSNRKRNQFRHWCKVNGWDANRVKRDGGAETFEFWNAFSAHWLREMMGQPWFISVDRSMTGGTPRMGVGRGEEKRVEQPAARPKGEWRGEVAYPDGDTVRVERFFTRAGYLALVTGRERVRVGGTVDGLAVADELSGDDAVALRFPNWERLRATPAKVIHHTYR